MLIPWVVSIKLASLIITGIKTLRKGRGSELSKIVEKF
jgi:hypothetical protein